MRCKNGFSRTKACYRWPNDLECSFKDTSTAEQSVSYSSGKVAWLSADQRIACIKNLTTGTVTEFITETRGVIRLIHLSEHFLFVQASGYELLRLLYKISESKPLTDTVLLGSCRPTGYRLINHT